MTDFRFEEGTTGVTSEKESTNPNFFGGLGAGNTVADFISELSDSFFRDILGDETMDKPLGSFGKEELFRVMAKVFLSEGFKAYVKGS